MKARSLFFLMCLLAFSGGAFATLLGGGGKRATVSHEHASCYMMYEHCQFKHNHSEAQCKVLYDAAVKAGGIWRSPDGTIRRYCHVD
jgi:hypothetical protein